MAQRSQATPAHRSSSWTALAGTTRANGLTLNASNCTILGLDITHFNADGIFVQGSNNVIQSNYIGTDSTGTKGQGNGGYGVEITAASKSNLVGTNGDGINDAAERNLLSGNGLSGVRITDRANQNVVAGNFIGTDVSGTVHIGNGRYGVSIENGAQSNLVGTNGDGVADTAERNLISGNTDAGVAIINTGTNLNVVAGNFIGTNVAGSAALPNGTGVFIGSGAQSNRIGTNGTDKDLAGERNLLSGNVNTGVQIDQGGTSSNVVAGNFIGTDVNGLVAVANGGDGILIGLGAQSNDIGTNADGVAGVAERNLISGNRGDGVALAAGTSQNMVAGNYIGTNVAGSAALPNGGNGVECLLGAMQIESAPTAMVSTMQPSETSSLGTGETASPSTAPGPTRMWWPATSSAPTPRPPAP